MNDAHRPELVLRRRGKVLARLVPGDRKLIGRASTADVVVDHASVSRLHARITWTAGKSAPVIEDLHSVNGVALDGREITGPTPLRHDMSIDLGSCQITVDLFHDAPPAVLPDEGTMRVRLFSEQGPRIQGTVEGATGLRAVLLEIEESRRTGTFVLKDQGQLTFADGRIVDAQAAGAREGLHAVRALLFEARSGPFRFELELSARECTLGLSVRELLARESPVTARVGRAVAS